MIEQEIFNRYTPTRSVITEKYNKHSAAERFFLSFLEDFEFGKNDNYPYFIFWLTKNGIPFMYLNKTVQKTRNLYIDYELIWKRLATDFGMQYVEIQQFIQHLLLHTIKLRDITPFKSFDCLVKTVTYYKT